MSDNLNVTPGSGAIVAAKDQGGVLHQRALLESLDATGAPVDASVSNPIPTNDDTVGSLLRRMIALLMSPRGYDKALARQRVTAAIENLPTLSTCTTVGTVTNMGTGRDAGQMLINPTNRTSWALNHRARIT